MLPSKKLNLFRRKRAMIRRAKRSDQERVGHMWHDLLRAQGKLDGRFAPSEDALERWRNDFPAWLDRLSRSIFVADVDGTLCGFITAEQWAPPPIFEDGPGVYVNELYVEPDRRRSGIGKELVEAVQAWAEEIGVRHVRAGVLARNDDAAAFWRAVGGEAVTQTFAITLDAQSVDAKSDAEKSERSLGFRL